MKQQYVLIKTDKYHSKSKHRQKTMEVLFKNVDRMFVPLCTGMVETTHLTSNTDYIVFNEINIERQISIIDYPKCKVVSFDDFLKIVFSKMCKDDIIEEMDVGTCHMEILDMFGDIVMDVERRYNSCKKAKKMTADLEAEYEMIMRIYDHVCECL